MMPRSTARRFGAEWITTLFFSGERGRNRTYNLLIKSQLLCQLSYAPFWVGPSGMEIFWRGSAKSRLIHCILTPLFKQAGIGIAQPLH